MNSIDRKIFVMKEWQKYAYEDRALPIGFHATISSPHIHAMGLELVSHAIKNTAHPRILDVGSGSGYLSYCFGLLV